MSLAKWCIFTSAVFFGVFCFSMTAYYHAQDKAVAKEAVSRRAELDAAYHQGSRDTCLDIQAGLKERGATINVECGE